MEIYRLKSFIAIMQAGNLTRAAEQLNLSQSALSSQLKQLEEELGVALFERSPRGMGLSDGGRELLPFVEAVLDSADKLAHKALEVRQGGGETLNIGLNTDPGFLRVGSINRRLAQLYGSLNVIFVASQTSRATQLLRQGQLDLAFLYGTSSDPDIHCRQLAEVRLCIVIPTALVPPGQPLDWPEIAALPWVWVEHGSPPYDAVLHELSCQRLVPNQSVKTVDEYIVKELVMDSQGVAVMREDEARPLVDSGRVIIWEKGWLTLPLSLAWMARNDDRFRIRTAREVISYLWQNSVRDASESLDRFNY
ncbi:MAG: LysR family transcriptional regulator [Desulfuromonadaceae bacterium]|nr:LysR family transcriptional regulator [Desulfuromonadaceae bacterium]